MSVLAETRERNGRGRRYARSEWAKVRGMSGAEHDTGVDTYGTMWWAGYMEEADAWERTMTYSAHYDEQLKLTLLPRSYSSLSDG